MSGISSKAAGSRQHQEEEAEGIEVAAIILIILVVCISRVSSKDCEVFS